MGGGEPDEPALPVLLVDLPQGLALPPASDRGDDVGDLPVLGDDPVGELSGRVEARVVTDDEVQVALQVARCPEELVDPPLRPRGDDDLRPRLRPGLDDALARATAPARNDHPTSTEVRERNLGQILVMHTAYYL